VRREYTQRLRKAPPREVADLARQLVHRYDQREVGNELLFHHRGALASLTADEVEELGAGMDSWGAVDCYGAYVSGPAWQAGIIDDGRVHRWARSADRWWRRAALVSTIYPRETNRTSETNRTRDTADAAARRVERGLTICRMLAADRDDMVVKALSWALRELSGYDRAAVEAFLAEHDRVLAGRVKREVRHKLETGLKNPRRKL